ncbi:hypothetical protein Hoch_0909 [Haliangium ochraceum DSM 14365]|uniref:Uncharacterized protein n=1 Tax=Haliangium ochraceum (strain DSM 14365 / JCM 11303 / SMP-2) TaxID=502025 RepID=D0LPF3_HALO1|nr:hypothetical protein Hoch_0909 [Haliangium ochraceum DSM 14365]
MEMFVRLKPFAPERGHVLRRYNCRGLRFREAGGWQRVPLDVAAYLRGVRQQPGDPRSPLAFDVCGELGADAEPVVTAERSGLPAPHAPGSEQGRGPRHRELASETAHTQPHREPVAAACVEPAERCLAAFHVSDAQPDEETWRPSPERNSTARTKTCVSLPGETANGQHPPAGALCAQARWTEQTSPSTDGASARSSARLLGPCRAAAPASHGIVASDLGASCAPRRPPVARRLRRHANRGPPVGTTRFKPRRASGGVRGRRLALERRRHRAPPGVCLLAE